MASLCWFRRDLRLSDNPAWTAACSDAAAEGSEVVALYVLDPALYDTAGEARRRQLVAHLRALDAAIGELGGCLRVERGDPAEVLPSVARVVQASAVHVNLDTTPYARRRDGRLAALLGTRWRGHWGTLVHEPGAVVTNEGRVSRVFTPFHTTWESTPWSPWAAADTEHLPPVAAVRGHGVPAATAPPYQPGGEAAAWERVARFADVVDDYRERNDLVAEDATSRLSADLRWGVLSPRAVIDELGRGSAGRRAFVRQLAWRDWYAHLLAELPQLRRRSMRPRYDDIRWRDDPAGIEAWKAGRTGYPIVDAGMRQLAETGWMHNRARLITASFLVKDLLVDWRVGERWFFDRLADGDVAQNAGNWQWVAGTGPDAAPYFRVFNPVTQGRKFDPQGTYVRRWVPELAAVDARWIHEPWAAPPLDLAAAGVVLGDTYPAPIVDHAEARERALAAYQRVR